jgi:hypothetical protein
VETRQPRPTLGALLLGSNLVTEEELAQALAEQETTGERLGAVVTRLGFVSGPALREMLLLQEHWRPIGRLLIENGLLTQAQLEDALLEQAETGERLGDVIRRNHIIPTARFDRLLAEQYELALEREPDFFTSGLRQHIDRRFREAHGRPVPDTDEREDAPLQAPSSRLAKAEEEREAIEPTGNEHDRIAALQRALEEREQTLATLGQANQRLNQTVEDLRAELAEREAVLAELRLRLGEAA